MVKELGMRKGGNEGRREMEGTVDLEMQARRVRILS